MDTSELKQMILQVVASIPAGNVASYGQVAKVCGYSSYSRFVGTVLKQLPANSALPWHRVINGKGEISFPVGSDAHNKQLTLLTQEGVRVENGKISLRIYGWSA